MSPAEVLRLRELAAGRRVLELGAWCGHTTIELARVAELVVSVDWHHGDAHAGEQDTLARYMANVRHFPNVVPIVGRFEQVAGLLQPIYELVIVDGQHDVGSVKRDLAIARLLAAEGATILVHDYGRFDGDVRAGVLAAGMTCVSLTESLATVQ